MMDSQKKINRPVRREHADSYLLMSLLAFAVTVIGVREFLQLTGFPQIGNSVLHIAHALWGGLLLFIAVVLPLAFANRWAIGASALLSGAGIGLFIDEVGKFITQTNDYFFPPALSIIYAFFLLTAVVYLYFRQPHREDARSSMYHVLNRLKDVLDGDLDIEEGVHIKQQLDRAVGAERNELACLAKTLRNYMQEEMASLAAAEPSLGTRVARWLDATGRRVGQRTHGLIISALLLFWLAVVGGYIVLLIQGGSGLSEQVLQWRTPLLIIQALIAGMLLVALIYWLTGNEGRGINFAVGGFLLSLVALQTLYFYLSQFSALTSTLFQVGILLILFAYRRWYLDAEL